MPSKDHAQECIKIIAETDQAVCVKILRAGALEDLWVPLSQVNKIVRRADGSGIVHISFWMARKKGLIA